MPGPAFFIDVEDDEDEVWRRLACVARLLRCALSRTFSTAGSAPQFVGSATTQLLATATNKGGTVEPTPRYYSLLEAAGDVKPIMIGIASSACVFAGR